MVPHDAERRKFYYPLATALVGFVFGQIKNILLADRENAKAKSFPNVSTPRLQTAKTFASAVPRGWSLSLT